VCRLWQVLARDMFELAADGGEWLTPDGLKEMMRWFSLQLEQHQLSNVLSDVKHQCIGMDDFADEFEMLKESEPAEESDGVSKPKTPCINVRMFFWLIEKSKKTAYATASYREAFKVLDPDGDGELTREELQRGMELVNLDLSDADADRMLAYADDCVASLMARDRQDADQAMNVQDGKVMQDEFLTFMGQANRFILAGDNDTAEVRSHWLEVRSLLLVIHTMYELWQKALLIYDEEYMEQWDPFSASRRCFYNPNSPGRQAWDAVMLPLMLIIAVTVPYRIGFDIEVEVNSVGFWIDAGIDLYFIVDIFVNFRTAFFNDRGVIVTSSKAIAKRYLKTWFLVDFVSCVPISYVLLLVKELEQSDEQSGGSQLKVAKILRLIRLGKNLARIARLKKLKSIIANYEDYLEPILTSLNLLKLFLLLLFMGHVMACFWYAVGREDQVLRDGQIIRGWVAKEGWGPPVTKYTRYVAAYYYALTDFAVEIGQTNLERIYGLFQHLVYETFFGFLVGTFATIVMSGRVSEQLKQQKLQAVREFARIQKVPMKGRKQIRSFYDIMYRHNTVFNEAELLNDLPECVRRTLTHTIHRNFCVDFSFFRGFQEVREVATLVLLSSSACA
jgi:Ca2+-binding EF-hand superfamily protein